MPLDTMAFRADKRRVTGICPLRQRAQTTECLLLIILNWNPPFHGSSLELVPRSQQDPRHPRPCAPALAARDQLRLDARAQLLEVLVAQLDLVARLHERFREEKTVLRQVLQVVDNGLLSARESEQAVT